MTRIAKGPRRLKRFYKDVSIIAADGAYSLMLDGKPAKTRGRRMLCAPTKALAAAIAEEWNRQSEFIQFTRMPQTRLMMTALDLGESDGKSWLDVVFAHLNADLTCYRADAPAALAERQARHWDCLLDWARQALGVSLITTNGVGHIEQPAAAFEAARALLADVSNAELLGIKTAAEAAGSAVIALALWRQAFAPAALFAASRVDEDFQIERWGADNEAEMRAAEIEKTFLEAGNFIRMLSESTS